MSSINLAINISFLFKERPFLERFEAAASAGKLINRNLRSSLRVTPQNVRSIAGFKAVEWGAEVPDLYSVQELVAAREKARVSVIGLCTPAGMIKLGSNA